MFQKNLTANKLRSVLLFIVVLFSFIFFGLESSIAKTDTNNYVSFLISKAKQDKIYEDPYWKILLHYNEENHSIIEDEKFFLSDDGNHNPESELYSTIKEFFSLEQLTDQNNHSICKYPARFKWISDKLNISNDSLPKVVCSEFIKYKNNLGAEKIEISFASENVNNLMSMMGHIFIKISGKKNNKNTNHALSYFADFSTGNPIVLASKALFSSSSGLYLLEPYEKRVKEYNNNQKRSIWEYELILTQEQINSLVLHIWEMKYISPKYNFIFHNCGSALIYLLFSADPNIKNLPISSIDTPIDLIKTLKMSGYIKRANLVPADNYKFRMMLKNFSSSDLNYIEKIFDNKDVDIIDFEDEQRKANIIYGVKTLLDYKLNSNDINQDEYNILYDKIESVSASLPKNDLVYEIKSPVEKDKSSQLLIGLENQSNNNNILSFEFYPAYNSLYNDNSGYFNEFELKLANIKGYYSNKNKIRIDNFDLIKVKSLIPYNGQVGGLSGSFNISLEKEEFSPNSGSMFFNSSFGIGIGSNFVNENSIIYFMEGFGYSSFAGLNNFYTNPEIGLIVKEGKYGKLNVNYTKYFSSNENKYNDRAMISQVFFLKNNNNVILSFERNNTEKEKIVNIFSVKYAYNF